jgi:type I restriction enzyme S subunit
MSYWKGGTVPWVKTGEIASGLITDTEERITNMAVTDLGLRRFPVGTVLLAMYGEGVTRGRVAMLETPACINQACAALIARKGRIDQSYLFHVLRSQYEELRALGQGSNQTNLSGGLIAIHRIPLPPTIHDQVRISAQLGGFDAMIEKEVLSRAKLAALKTSLAADLLTGRIRVPTELAS